MNSYENVNESTKFSCNLSCLKLNVFSIKRIRLNNVVLILPKKSMDIVVRRAIKEDCSRMLELIQELAEYERAPEQVTVSPEHFMQSGFGENPVWWAFVAETEAQIIGFALYYIRYSTWKGQRMYLEDILVTEKMRGMGAGNLLMQQLIKEASEKGFKGISWQVLDWNEPAINFYKKFEGLKTDDEWINFAIDF